MTELGSIDFGSLFKFQYALKANITNFKSLIDISLIHYYTAEILENLCSDSLIGAFFTF